MIKVRVIYPFVIGDESFSSPDEPLLETDVAYSLALKGVVEFKNKKEFTALDEKIKVDEKSKQEQKEEEERKVAAILEKDFLENKRANLQSEVDAITHILDDAVVYYKSYIDLLDDLNKQESEQKKDEQNQGNEEK